MLINFKVKNFRSFKEEIEFSMEAASDIKEYQESHVRKIGEYDLLKSAVLFGANASGKSNFIQALESLVILITEPTPDAIEFLYVDPFFSNSEENATYQVEFIKNSKCFDYRLEINRNEVVVEKLIMDGEVHFERQKQEFVKIPKAIEKNVENIRKNQLMLFFAQAQNDSESIDAYTWFNRDLVFADAPVREKEVILALKTSLKNEVFKERFLSLLKYADFNIADIDVLDKTNGCIRESVITTHTDDEGEKFKIRMFDESEGTIKFVLIASELMLNNANDGKVIIFDEFARSLYQELSQTLLYLINSEKQNNQFILTTHELSLMNCDLRTDQIYFTEKNRNSGSTKLFSLFDFDDPELEKEYVDYEQRYLSGRYGGVPIISSTIMKNILEEDDA